MEVKSAALLVLDDLSIESATPWAREKLMQLVDYRYVAALPTVITTAADKDELDDWMQSRLLDPRLSVICPITAPIYKGGKGAGKKKRK
jgi:DNA replication protein DnaC